MNRLTILIQKDILNLVLNDIQLNYSFIEWNKKISFIALVNKSLFNILSSLINKWFINKYSLYAESTSPFKLINNNNIKTIRYDNIYLDFKPLYPNCKELEITKLSSDSSTNEQIIHFLKTNNDIHIKIKIYFVINTSRSIFRLLKEYDSSKLTFEKIICQHPESIYILQSLDIVKPKSYQIDINSNQSPDYSLESFKDTNHIEAIHFNNDRKSYFFPQLDIFTNLRSLSIQLVIGHSQISNWKEFLQLITNHSILESVSLENQSDKLDEQVLQSLDEMILNKSNLKSISLLQFPCRMSTLQSIFNKKNQITVCKLIPKDITDEMVDFIFKEYHNSNILELLLLPIDNIVKLFDFIKSIPKLNRFYFYSPLEEIDLFFQTFQSLYLINTFNQLPTFINILTDKHDYHKYLNHPKYNQNYPVTYKLYKDL